MASTNQIESLKELRFYEVEKTLEFLPLSGKLLEIGAGAGWQAKQFFERGYDVSALDIKSNKLKHLSEFPVLEYDGLHFPFPDKHFDIVYSSNVLEHVLELDILEKEIYRVLKPKAIAVHILPTISWRLGTSLTHPLYLFQLAYRYLTNKRNPIKNTDDHFLPSFWQLWKYLLPSRHGVKGNSFSELYNFSSFYWSRHFKSCKWNVVEYQPSCIFYSGNQILHKNIDLAWRRRLSQYLGSATSIWVLKKLQ